MVDDPAQFQQRARSWRDRWNSSYLWLWSRVFGVPTPQEEYDADAPRRAQARIDYEGDVILERMKGYLWLHGYDYQEDPQRGVDYEDAS